MSRWTRCFGDCARKGVDGGQGVGSDGWLLHRFDVQEEDRGREGGDGGRVGYCEEWRCELFGEGGREKLERESFLPPRLVRVRFVPSRASIEADLFHSSSSSPLTVPRRRSLPRWRGYPGSFPSPPPSPSSHLDASSSFFPLLTRFLLFSRFLQDQGVPGTGVEQNHPLGIAPGFEKYLPESELPQLSSSL